MQITLNEGASATFIDIHDNEVVNLSVDKGVVRVDEKKAKTVNKSNAGRRQGSLFEDPEESREKAEYFLQILADKGIEGIKIDSSAKNPINVLFRKFYSNHVRHEVPNGPACFRFLREDCGLTFDVDKKTYVEFVRKFVKE